MISFMGLMIIFSILGFFAGYGFYRFMSDMLDEK